MSARRAQLALIAIVAVAALWPILGAGFLEFWDDPDTIVHNPDLNPPSPAKVLKYWDPRQPYMDLYVPVTYTAWAGIAALTRRPGGDPNVPALRPLPFHAANLMLHVAASWLVFAILALVLARAGPPDRHAPDLGRRAEKHRPAPDRARKGAGNAGGKQEPAGPTAGVVWAACLGALLFAVHPLQVETVAWASGLKDVLGGTLALGAILLGLRSLQSAAPPDSASPSATRSLAAADSASQVSTRTFVVATVLLPLAILAKPSAVAAIPILAVLGYFALGRSVRALAPRIVVWLLVAAPLVVAARLAQATTSGFASPPLGRPFVALDALGFYLQKLVMPLNLAIDYGRSPDATQLAGASQWLWLAPLAVGVVAWLGRRRWPWGVTAALVFALGLLPTLGLAKFNFQYYSTVADHYVYLAMLGPALAFAALVVGWPQGRAAAAGFVILTPLALVAHQQAFHWRSAEALFQHTLTVNPSSVAANVNAGMIALGAGRADVAEPMFRKAIAVRPGDAEVHMDLGNALLALGREGEAVAAYRAGLAILPDHAMLHYDLGIALARTGDLDGARAAYEASLARNPRSAEAHTNLAGLLVKQGRMDEAIAHYRTALEIDPSLTPARNGLAMALQGRGSAP